jgi:lysylphosphatidylglycerol synthetase-like protein (DUF2156 family)
MRNPGVDGFVAYRPAGRRHLVQFGGVFAAEDDQGPLLDYFLAEARRQHRKVVSIQLQHHDAERYAANGFTVNQFGACYARSLAGFSLAGKTNMRLRNKLSRARRCGLTVSEVGPDVPTSAALESELDALDRLWLHSKGRHVKELRFMVGQRGGPATAWRRTFIATCPSEPGSASSRVVAYVTFAPVGGRHPGWLHDLSRRHPEAPPGTMETIVATAIEHFGDEGAGYLHFGLTPFTGLDSAAEFAGHSPVARKTVGLLAAHGKVIYPAADQLAYKLKWAPDLIMPEYVAFSAKVSLGAIWALLRLTNAA